MTVDDKQFDVIEIADGSWALKSDTGHAVAAIRDGRLRTEVWLENALRPYVYPKMTVWDIGAFVGDLTRFFLDEGCETFAFEPYPDAFFCLAHNCRDATIFNCAVGDGRLVNLGGSEEPTYPHERGNCGVRRVVEGGGLETRKLDDLCIGGFIREPDLIKIDVEGFEPAVLRGMEQTLVDWRPLVAIEIYRSCLQRCGFTEDDIHGFFLRHDYKGHVIVGNGDEDRSDWLFQPE